MKTLYFGGSFNPIGNHHLLLAQFAMEAGGYDRVSLVPCFDPAHKETADYAAFNDRFRMCEEAARWQGSRIVVDPIEQILGHRTGRKSYTYDTVMALKESGADDVHLLIGGDTAEQLHTWYRIADLMKEVRFVVVPRMGRYGPQTVSQKVFEFARGHLNQLITPDIPVIDVSSSLIRSRIRQGLSIRLLVPPGVEAIIDEFKLYRR